MSSDSEAKKSMDDVLSSIRRIIQGDRAAVVTPESADKTSGAVSAPSAADAADDEEEETVLGLAAASGARGHMSRTVASGSAAASGPADADEDEDGEALVLGSGMQPEETGDTDEPEASTQLEEDEFGLIRASAAAPRASLSLVSNADWSRDGETEDGSVLRGELEADLDENPSAGAGEALDAPDADNAAPAAESAEDDAGMEALSRALARIGDTAEDTGGAQADDAWSGGAAAPESPEEPVTGAADAGDAAEAAATEEEPSEATAAEAAESTETTDQPETDQPETETPDTETPDAEAPDAGASPDESAADDTGETAADEGTEEAAMDDRATDLSPPPDLAIDPAEMEETIRRVIREELEGDMGQRLSKNIQRMIRDEVARAMLRR